MIYPSVNMLTGKPEKDYTKKPMEKQRTKKPTYLGYEIQGCIEEMRETYKDVINTKPKRG